MRLVVPQTFQNASFLSTQSGPRSAVVPVIHNSGYNHDSSGWSIVVLPRLQRFKDERLGIFQSHCRGFVAIKRSAAQVLRHELAFMTWKSRKRAPLSSAEVLVYQFCLFHFNSLSFDSLSVRVGENEALVPYY